MEALHSHEQPSQENEFEIGSADGLRRFQEYVDEAYHAILTGADNSIESDHYTAGKAAYEKVKNIITENLAALEEGKEVSDETIEKLQELYNEMWSIADALIPTNDNEESKTIAANDNVSGETLAANDNNTDLAETMQGSVIIEEAEGVSPIKPLEAIISEEAFSAAIKTATTLHERAKALLEKYESAAKNHPDTGTFNAMAYFYEELKTSAVRVEAIANMLSHAGTKDNLDVLEFQHFEDGLQEVSENLDQLEIGIEKLINPTAEEEGGEIEAAIAAPIKPATGALSIGHEEKEYQTITIERPAPLVPPPAPTEKPRAINARLEVPIRSKEKRERQSTLAPFVDRALRDRRYAAFVEETFSEPFAFELELHRHINEIENPSRFNKVFGFTHESAFHSFLKDLTIAEIDSFERQPNAQIRERLLDMNIEYETYVRWLDAFYEMIQTFRVPTSMTFGELFVRSELEDLMNHYYARM